MRILKSSVVRQNINKLLAEVAAENSVIGIESNGEVVAVLTAKAPQWEIGPILLLAEDARAHWADVINTVAVRNAGFYFYRKTDDKKVYLKRDAKYRNPMTQRWVAHVNEHKPQSMEISRAAILDAQEEAIRQLEELTQTVIGVGGKINLIFALVNRKGDLLAGSGSGAIKLANADDVDHYASD